VDSTALDIFLVQVTLADSFVWRNDGTVMQMKVGVEDHRKVLVACALCAVALVMLGHWIFGLELSVSASSASNAIAPAASAVPARRIKANKTDSLDPTLQLAQLELTEHEVYEGTGRNIFQSYGEQQPEKPQPASKPQPTPPATILVTAAAPPVGLKFFGIATASNSPRKVCLTQDGDVFIGSEGNILDRRYKILHIGSNSVDIEDVLENKQYTLALQQ
jgi:hypothetical protein